MPHFIPGLELNRLFYQEAIRPVIDSDFPGLKHSAARLGMGSEVLGYDTPMSTDHDWGPRLQLFLSPADYAKYRDDLHEALRQKLPQTFLGYSTHFGQSDAQGTRLMAETDGPVDHQVDIWTIGQFFTSFMACDPYVEPAVVDWLIWPQQHLLGVTAGAVYVDQLEELQRIRAKLRYYPHDVWLYLLAAQWARIGQEEHFVGRTGGIGDALGSRLLATRLVHDMMMLCFLQEKRYAPYPKWFGTAFKRLGCAAELGPILMEVLRAETWQVREERLCQAYVFVARRHNALKITNPLPAEVKLFHGRPFRVIEADRFEMAIKEQISDPQVRRITTDIGSIDQFSNSTDLRSDSRLHRKLQALYEPQ